MHHELERCSSLSFIPVRLVDGTGDPYGVERIERRLIRLFNLGLWVLVAMIACTAVVVLSR